MAKYQRSKRLNKFYGGTEPLPGVSPLFPAPVLGIKEPDHMAPPLFPAPPQGINKPDHMAPPLFPEIINKHPSETLGPPLPTLHATGGLEESKTMLPTPTLATHVEVTPKEIIDPNIEKNKDFIKKFRTAWVSLNEERDYSIKVDRNTFNKQATEKMAKMSNVDKTKYKKLIKYAAIWNYNIRKKTENRINKLKNNLSNAQNITELKKKIIIFEVCEKFTNQIVQMVQQSDLDIASEIYSSFLVIPCFTLDDANSVRSEQLGCTYIITAFFKANQRFQDIIANATGESKNILKTQLIGDEVNSWRLRCDRRSSIHKCGNVIDGTTSWRPNTGPATLPQKPIIPITAAPGTLPTALPPLQKTIMPAKTPPLAPETLQQKSAIVASGMMPSISVGGGWAITGKEEDSYDAVVGYYKRLLFPNVSVGATNLVYYEKTIKLANPGMGSIVATGVGQGIENVAKGMFSFVQGTKKNTTKKIGGKSRHNKRSRKRKIGRKQKKRVSRKHRKPRGRKRRTRRN